MWWRLKRSLWSAQKGEANKCAFKKIILEGHPPGLIAYIGKTPVGWCAVAPRNEYSALERSRILKRIDDLPVWSIVCFFTAKPYRRIGITTALVKAAVQYAAKRGAVAVEGYPSDPGKDLPDVFAYTGLVSAFRQAGFHEVARRSKGRPIMRYLIESKKKKR
jgi:GNAT superfamily N-acetyltransferase